MSYSPKELAEKRRRNDKYNPGWRQQKHANGAPKYHEDGTLLNDQGKRSIFDDVDK